MFINPFQKFYNFGNHRNNKLKNLFGAGGFFGFYLKYHDSVCAHFKWNVPKSDNLLSRHSTGFFESKPINESILRKTSWNLGYQKLLSLLTAIRCYLKYLKAVLTKFFIIGTLKSFRPARSSVIKVKSLII